MLSKRLLNDELKIKSTEAPACNPSTQEAERQRLGCKASLGYVESSQQSSTVKPCLKMQVNKTEKSQYKNHPLPMPKV